MCTRAGANLGVLEVKISVLRPKFVIIRATCAGANLSVLALKITVLRQELVIICASRAGVNLGYLRFKSTFLVKNSHFWLKISDYLCHSCGTKLSRFII